MFGSYFKKCLVLLGLLAICQVNNIVVSNVDSPMLESRITDFYQVPGLWVLIKHKRYYLVSFSHETIGKAEQYKQSHTHTHTHTHTKTIDCDAVYMSIIYA